MLWQTRGSRRPNGFVPFAFAHMCAAVCCDDYDCDVMCGGGGLRLRFSCACDCDECLLALAHSCACCLCCFVSLQVTRCKNNTKRVKRKDRRGKKVNEGKRWAPSLPCLYLLLRRAARAICAMPPPSCVWVRGAGGWSGYIYIYTSPAPARARAPHYHSRGPRCFYNSCLLDFTLPYAASPSLSSPSPPSFPPFPRGTRVGGGGATASLYLFIIIIILVFY
jgi:hypothetical protein